jgi:hypothetical protein
MLVRSGSMNLTFTSNIPHSGVVTVSIPDAVRNGQSLSCQLPFTYSGSQINTTLPVDLSGYFINLHAGSSPGMLTINYSVTYSNSSSSLSLSGRQSKVRLDFTSINFTSIYGNFGQQSVSLFEDSALITLFSNFENGTLFFDDPSMTFTLKNSFGMPIDAHVTSLAALNRNGSSFPITGAIPNPLPVSYPTVPGQTATGSFVLDKTNSNIRSVISQCPKYIVYSLNALSNSPVPSYNFLLDSSAFTADIRIDLPMRGYASGFTVEDTADFTLDRIEDLKSATFRINIDNGFPATAYTQIYFVDSNYAVLDSMIIDPLNAVVESAPVDNSGRVISSMHKMTDEQFSAARLEHLYHAKKLLITSLINTKDFQSNRIVEIYDSYKIDVKVGVRAQLNIK